MIAIICGHGKVHFNLILTAMYTQHEILRQISCSDSENDGSGYFEGQSEEAGGSSGGTSGDIILYGSSNSSGSDSISINDVSGESGEEDSLHNASAEDSSSMIKSSTYSK